MGQKWDHARGAVARRTRRAHGRGLRADAGRADEHGRAADHRHRDGRLEADRDQRKLDGVAHLVRVPVDTLPVVRRGSGRIELRRDRRRLDGAVRSRQHRRRQATPRPRDRSERRRREDRRIQCHRSDREGREAGQHDGTEHLGHGGGRLDAHATKGEWTGTDPITFGFAWLRCDTGGGSCAAIGGANDTTYVLKSVDLGNTMRVRVTAKNRPGRSVRRLRPRA